MKIELNRINWILFHSSGSVRKLKENPAQLFIRTRGWHLDEKHLVIDGKPISGAFMDFGLYLFHNTKPRMDRGSAPYFYLPKMEHRTEAALWNEVFKFAENYLKIPQGNRIWKSILSVE